MIIRKMELTEVHTEKIGIPAELSQHMLNVVGISTNGNYHRSVNDHSETELIKIEEEEI